MNAKTTVVFSHPITVCACAGTETNVQDNRVVSNPARPTEPAYLAGFCGSGLKAAQVVDQLRRLMTPMRRSADGHVLATHDEAQRRPLSVADCRITAIRSDSISPVTRFSVNSNGVQPNTLTRRKAARAWHRSRRSAVPTGRAEALWPQPSRSSTEVCTTVAAGPKRLTLFASLFPTLPPSVST